MPDTTPILGLPFPVPADPADVPSDIEALAVALDTLLGRGVTRQVLSGVGVYQTPAGVRALLVECIGAGGGSAIIQLNPNNSGGSGGGGGGAYAAGIILDPDPTYEYVVGAGGVAGNPAQSGGDSRFGPAAAPLVLAKGGGAASFTYTGGNFGAGGGGAPGASGSCVGAVKMDGDGGTHCFVVSLTVVIPGNGGAAARGGGSRITAGAATTANGLPGLFPGGGASGCKIFSSGTGQGDSGGNGTIIVTEL